MAPDQRVERLRYLSGLARSVQESGPAPIARSTLRLNADSATLHRLLLIDALYHMCQMALHSSMVPYFSPSSDNSSINVNLVRTSIQSVLLHADSFATVLKSYMDNFDASYICPLVGYGAYMAGAILIAVERSIHQGLLHRFGLAPTIMAAQDRIGTAKALAGILRTLCRYWTVLRIPASTNFMFWLCQQPSVTPSLISASRKNCSPLLQLYHQCLLQLENPRQFPSKTTRKWQRHPNHHVWTKISTQMPPPFRFRWQILRMLFSLWILTMSNRQHGRWHNQLVKAPLVVGNGQEIGHQILGS